MDDSEAPLVVETQGGLSVSYRGRLLYSSRDAAGLPRRVAAACDKGPSRLHLVPSPLLWHGVSELLAAMGPGSAILCVESDPALAALARGRLPIELSRDPRLSFVEASSPEAAVAAAKALGSFRACSISALSGGDALDAALYKAMAEALRAEFEASWKNRATLMAFGPRWARNIFGNLGFLPEIAPLPFPRLPGPVAVCGAGASLEEALPLIARESSRGRLRVVACDTALGTLLAAGIEPDLVVCLEGQAHNLADFTCLGSRPLPLAADLSSHPAGFRAVRGPKHLSLVRIADSPFLDRVRAGLEAGGIPHLAVPPLGSVGVHAFLIARLSRGGPLLATGLDFSFEAGKTHARGCPSLLAEAGRLDRLTRWSGQYASSFRERSHRLDGNRAPPDGRSQITDPLLLSYAALLADLASHRPVEGPGAFDLRGRGPSIGLPRIGLEEAQRLIDEWPRDGEAHGWDQEPGFAEKEPSSPASVSTALIAGELERLDGLRTALRGGRRVADEELGSLVAALDYLWWGFPDRPGRVRPSQDFLNRLVPQIEWWSSRLESIADPL